MKSPTRQAFTVFQLLVILAILGFLLGLLFPLIQQIRQAAARTQSANNLKQIGIACHNYHDVYRTLPPGNDANGFSVHARLLPFIEQDNLHRRINFNALSTANVNAQVRQTRIPVLVSPLDPAANNPKSGAVSNYLFCAGSQYALKKNSGVFFQDSKVRIFDITDGTSNTIMTGETLIGQAGGKSIVARQHVALKEKALNGLNQNSGVNEFKNNKNIQSTRGASWMDGRFLQGTFTTTRTINDAKPDVDCGGAGGLSGLRSLTNGAHVGMCDGSVRFVNGNVSLRTWNLVGSRADGQPIPADW